MHLFTVARSLMKISLWRVRWVDLQRRSACHLLPRGWASGADAVSDQRGVAVHDCHCSYPQGLFWDTGCSDLWNTWCPPENQEETQPLCFEMWQYALICLVLWSSSDIGGSCGRRGRACHPLSQARDNSRLSELQPSPMCGLTYV